MESNPKLDFISYIMMLYQSGQIALGKMPNPVDGDTKLSLETVRSIIELLKMLKEKTQGNLNQEEERILNMILDTMKFDYAEEEGKIIDRKKTEPYELNEGEEFDIH